jgi:DNA-directed RNA polymerase specialized sigma24 family protein
MVAGRSEASELDGASRALAALVALLAADRDERADGTPARRSEVVLAEAGFSYQEIANLTGKKQETVRGKLRRVKGKSANAKELKS